MKLKKIIGMIILTIATLLIASGFNKSYAATGSKYLNIRNLRASGYGYKALEKNIWKIYETNSEDSIVNFDNTIYCLKGGPGFGSTNFGEGKTRYKEYTKYFDMKNPGTIESPYVDALPDVTSTTYKSLVWLLEHVYVAPKTNASTEERNSAAQFRDQLLESAGIAGGGYLTDDDIDVVQQLAIWHFTNNDEYKIEQGGTFELWINAIAGSDANYNPMSDDVNENGWDRADECKKLFNYLVNTATTEGSKYIFNTDTSTDEKPSQISTQTTPEVRKSGNNYVIGPLKIIKNQELNQTLQATLSSNAGVITPTKIQDANGNTFANYEATIGRDFYLVIPKSTDIEGLKFAIAGSYKKTNITYWAVNGADESEQPVAIVERKDKTYSDEITLATPEKIFDLALRKFIVSINGVAPQVSRIPQISGTTLANLANENITTAEKVHPKNALTIQNGNKVIYTIRVYNEGELSGYATEITDFLPAGLKLAENSTINTANGWTNPSGDGQTVVSNKLATTLLQAFNGSNLDFADIQLECEITATALQDERYLKNIAEITGATDSKGVSLIDRDSTPNNVDIDKYGTTSQQDDDDFEMLVMEKATGNYELELEKVDGYNDGVKLNGARFEITLPDGTKQTLETDAEGKIKLSNLPITQVGTQTIKIKETKAASGYSNGNLEINVLVNTSIENGQYVIDANITSTNNGLIDTEVIGNKIGIKVKNYKLDLALRKFIASINGVAPQESREPQISTETLTNLQNGTTTTAEKVHPKNALTVKTGDKVVYTIRIYNEGKIDGYVKEITDYLPDGLKLAENSEINSTNGWKNPSGDRKTIVTDELSGTLLKAFEGTTLQSLDVQVECEVTAVAGEADQELKNIAEITVHSDANSDTTVADRDSTPNNVNRANYGTTSQQDDDDFELLVIEKAKGKYEVEIVKVDKENTETKLEGAEFEVTLPDGRKQTLTTNSEGKINIADLAISEAGSQVITMQETKAPDGYNVNVSNISINIITKLENGVYVIESATANGVEGVTCTSSGSKVSIEVANEPVKIELDLDLALRKFITSINGEAPETSREPQISPETLNDLANVETTKVTTAEKVHPKDALTVKTGDKVVYTIRVYNEGQVDGYAKEITDYLPEGLKLAENSIINQENGWTNPLNDEKTIVTNKLSERLLKAFNGTTLDCADIQVECEVIALSGETNQELKNIAEITAHSNSEGDTTIIDRDSEPHNVDKDKYGTTNQQDDDFEILVLDKAKGDYQLEIVKLDGENTETKLEGAVFEVTLPDGRKQTLTTNEEGKINIADLVISQSGEQIITIKEIKAPSGYSKYTPDIVVKVTTVLENGKYVVSTAELNSVIDGVTCDKQNNKIVVQLDNYKLDLALRKFITSINGEAPEVSREPQVSAEALTNLQNGTTTTAEKVHPKEALIVKTGDKVVYTIRVYNEGKIDAYAKEVTDYLPEGLKLAENSTINQENGWTNPSGDEKTIVTNKLSERLLKAFNGETLDCADIQIECEVTLTSESLNLNMKNIAEITIHSDKNDDTTVLDRDSTPNNVDKENYGTTSQEDDDDFEELVLQRFDLSLRKFITGVNDNEISDRVPVFSMNEDKKFVYTHPKTPVEVATGDTVIYTLRVYNEGNQAGYAEEVKDNLPEGLVFLPDNEINKEYRWKLYKEDGTETNNVEEAKTIKTDYLSKAQETETNRDNLLDAFNTETMTQPDHRDLKIAFKIAEPNTSDRIIINTAEISEDKDEKGKSVDDIDSTPNNNEEGEDDIDIEKVKVKYFDLALEKIITEYSINLDGKTTVTKTRHKFGVQPEPVVKIELKNYTIENAVIKYKYQIKITNEGEMAGYAEKVKDYIPEGLKFVQADNPNWKLGEDGKTVITDQLKDTLLQPGDSATVEITLQWINGQHNLGLKQNWAEISEDKDEHKNPVDDIDSTPNNKKNGEDDIDEASVVLSITTGIGKNYIAVAGSILVILTAGVVLIKKFVI